MPSRIFFTADTHFGHRGIIEHCNRPFLGVKEMDAALIQLWNSTVNPNDVVWHLGDFAWRNHEDYLEALNGHIHLVSGNHDKFSARVAQKFERVVPVFEGHVASGAPLMFLFHYPLVSWPKKFKGESIHLYGHVHGRYSRDGEASLDVGVDCHNYQPIPLEEVVRLATIKLNTPRVEEQYTERPETSPGLSAAAPETGLCNS
jgi:calcineurin-like phosphoesterase family protein